MTSWLAWLGVGKLRQNHRRGSTRVNVERLEQRTLLSGTGVFVESNQQFEISSATAEFGDVNGDGFLDLMLDSYQHAGTRILFNDGTGRFADSGQTLSRTMDLEFGDLDGDGDLDAVGVANGVTVWHNNGQGYFGLHQSGWTEELARTVALGDLDGDGDLDAFVGVTGTGARSFFLLNDGTGVFGSGHSELPQHTNTVDLALGDLDADGDLDVYLSSGKLFFNDGNANFVDSGQRAGADDPRGVALGDVDGDGDLDSFITSTVYSPDKVWFNDGQGHFSDSGQELAASGFGEDVALGDLDGDGDLDAFVSQDYGWPNLLWLNDGSGNFTESGQQLGVSERGLAVALGDVDGDGDFDAFVAGDVDRLWLNHNQLQLPAGGGSFVLVRENTDLVVREQGGVDLLREPFANVSGLIIEGSPDDDVVLLDFSGGDPVPAGGVTVKSGAGDDVVTVSGIQTATTAALYFDGEDGNDRLDMGPLETAVTLDGGAGNDTLIGGTSHDLLLGNADADRMNGRRGRDTIEGGPGNDKLFGGGGRDSIDGGPGDDKMRGHGARDTLRGGDGDDTLLGGTARDRVVEWGDADFTLTDESLTGRGNDRLGGIEQAELTGGHGDNTLDARDFTGRVTLSGGSGADSLFGGSNRDYLDGGHGNDTLNGGAGKDGLFGGDGDDAINGMAGNDKLVGGRGHDTMLGGEGNDKLRGQVGNDIALGGPGVDYVNGNNANDTDTVAGGGNGVAADINDTVIGETTDDDFMFDAPWVDV